MNRCGHPNSHLFGWSDCQLASICALDTEQKDMEKIFLQVFSLLIVSVAFFISLFCFLVIPSVQSILFESVARLVADGNEYSQFNVVRLREAGLIDILLKMFQEEADSLPLGLAPTLIAILHAIMTDPPSTTDLQVKSSIEALSNHASEF